MRLAEEPDVVYRAFKGAMVTGDYQLFIPSVGNSLLWKHFSEGYMQASEPIIHMKGLSSSFSAQDFLREYEEYAEDFLI